MPNPLHRLKFLLTATNEHGVHSPFIFKYVTKCLYAPPEYSRQTSENILCKSVDYFTAKRVWLPDNYENLKDRMLMRFPDIQFDSGPYDILFVHPSEFVRPIKNPRTSELPYSNEFADSIEMFPSSKTSCVSRATQTSGNKYSPKAEKRINMAFIENKTHNDSLLLVDNIHENKTHLSIWEHLKSHPKTTVTVDLFYCGAIFFRKQQAEQHFKIRI